MRRGGGLLPARPGVSRFALRRSYCRVVLTAACLKHEGEGATALPPPSSYDQRLVLQALLLADDPCSLLAGKPLARLLEHQVP